MRHPKFPRFIRVFVVVGALAAFATGCHDNAPGETPLTDTPVSNDLPPGVDTAPDTNPFSDLSSPDSGDPDVKPPSDVRADTVTTDVSGDTSGVCDRVGCPCTTNSDCLDGLCIEGLDGGVCTQACIAECPAGSDCLLSTAFGTDPISICVPQHTRLCRPCRSDDECKSGNDPFPAYCIPGDEPGDGSFCASSCAARGCPDGYSCEDVGLAGGGTAKQCMPTDGQCECRESWASFGFSTGCDVVNAFGACEGARSCGAEGLTACEGAQAAPEVCDLEDNDCNGAIDDIPALPCPITNGVGTCQGVTVCGSTPGAPVCSGREASVELCNEIDDNCNSVTDEASCDDGLTCTTDTCVSSGNCQAALLPNFCLVGGACWSGFQYNPLNACQQCNPGQSTSAWTQAPNTCIIGGQCFPNGATNPQNGCQICNANQSSTSWTTSSNTCTIGGQCYLANESNPASPCQICVPFTSTTTWTQASNTCNIQGTCYAAGVRRPGQECEICDPFRNASGWSNAIAGTSCNDGSACSPIDTCNGSGACTGNTACDDGIACTKNICGANGCDNSQVEDNWCRIGGTCRVEGVQNPANQCQACLPGASQATRTVWSNKPTNSACSDGNACTVEDKCNAGGSCVAGAAKNCSDGLSCTSDSCNTSSGVCSSSLLGGNCLISGGCYTNNTTQPNNVCYKCNTSSSTSNWSLNNGTSCNDGNSCTEGDTCSSGTCRGSDVRDAFESNDSAASAFNLGNSNDNQTFPVRKAEFLTFYGSGDVDWFHFWTEDVWPGVVRPRVRLEGIVPGTNYEFCAFYWCTKDDEAPTKVTCPSGTTGTTSSISGRTYEGCCRNGNSNGVLDISLGGSGFDCDAGDDDYRTYVSVRNTSNSWSCTNTYKLLIGDD